MEKEIKLEESKPNDFNIKKPVKVFRAGKIVISVWENTNKNGEKFRTCTIQKSFTTKDGEWKNVTSFTKRDLTEIAFACGKAYNEFEN